MREEWKDKLQNALADFEESAPEGLWENIDKALAVQGVSVKSENAGRHRRVVAIRVIVAAACVACGVGIFLSLPDSGEKTVNRHLANVETRHTTSVADKRDAGEMPESGSSSYRSAPSYKSAIISNSLHSASVRVKDVSSTDTTSLSHEEPMMASVMANGKEEKEESKVVNSGYRQSNARAFSSDSHLAYNTSRETSKREADGGITVSLYAMNSMGIESGGAGGVMVASSYNDAQFGMLFDDDGDAKFKFLAAKNNLQKEKATHHVPLRTGLSVRYALNNRLGIETGLTYTFLSSDFTLGEGGNRREREQRLHYIGIPVNVDYSLWHNRRFDVYVSAGGMVERNVSGNMSTTEYVNSSVLSSEEEDVKTKKLQWSVDAAAGAQLNIVDGVGIYIEPGIGYYFKNGSGLKTAYSERPVNFNLKLGLRYTFK